MRIMKFGGTSLGSPEGFRRALALVVETRRKEPVVVVVSALSGVTRSLREMTAEAGPPVEPWNREVWESVGNPHPADALEALQRRHLRLWEEVGRGASEGDEGVAAHGVERRIRTVVEELRVLRWVARAHGRWTPAARDRALGSGERLSALLMEGALRARGLPARLVEAEKVIRTDSSFGQARVRKVETERLARLVLEKTLNREIPVVPGFSGADEKGRSTTLGPGASDYTASILAAALSAREVEIWTDVEGVHRFDPRDRPDAPLLERMDYASARSMAGRGARVLHPMSLDPIEDRGIPLRVRNTFNPEGPGTHVGPGDACLARNTPDPGSHGRRAVRPEPRGTGQSPPPPRRGAGAGVVTVILAGASGGVGGTLLDQLRSQAPTIQQEKGIEIRVSGLLSSRGQRWFHEGCPLSELPAWDPAEGGVPEWDAVARRIEAVEARGVVFLDCTANPRVAACYPGFLRAGVSVVTPNKLALSGTLREYETLRLLSRDSGFRYETTVCAGLPVLGAVRDLRASGDRFHRIRGVLSGTLSFVFHQLARGVPFSRAVRDARDRGLTEPHPGEDLSGSDVARKLLILGREAGWALEPADIRVHSLTPSDLAGEADPEVFLKALEAHDPLWEERIRSKAPAQPVYVASLRNGEGRVGVEWLDGEDPLAGLRPTENRVALDTGRYREVPMTISGPGAGRDVTAAGVLADLVQILASRGRGGTPADGSAPARRGRVT